jgi:hypothetical protein
MRANLERTGNFLFTLTRLLSIIGGKIDCATAPRRLGGINKPLVGESRVAARIVDFLGGPNGRFRQ